MLHSPHLPDGSYLLSRLFKKTAAILLFLLCCYPLSIHAKPLAWQKEQLKTELGQLQKQSAEVAATIQQYERELSGLEEKLALLTEQERQKKRDSTLRQHQLASVIQGILRLSRTPPEAVIAIPGDYSQAMRTASVLGIASDAIRNEAQMLRQQLEEIATLEKTITQHRDTLIQQKQALLSQQATLAGNLAERTKLQEKLFAHERAQSRKIAEESRDAGSVKDLVSSLEAGHAQKQDVVSALEQSSGKLRPFRTAKGRIKLPAAGKITGFFGENKDGTETYKGILLTTRGEAQVTAPFDGEVVYTGSFRDYGRMVILRHSDGFHTLLAGLNKIDCAPGQFLLEGEPIGAMGNTGAGKPELYVELRQQGKPVDPAPWMRGASRLARE